MGHKHLIVVPRALFQRGGDFRVGHACYYFLGAARVSFSSRSALNICERCRSNKCKLPWTALTTARGDCGAGKLAELAQVTLAYELIDA